MADKSGAVQSDEMVWKFVNDFLRVDGVFLLRLIAHNTSGITATEITKEMWDVWYEQYVKKVDSDALDESTQIKTAV